MQTTAGILRHEPQAQDHPDPDADIARLARTFGLVTCQVATMIDAARPERAPTDQATIAKWESGETEVRVTDMYLLAQIYGTTADRLLFDPGDLITPELMRRAHAVLVSKDREALAAWLASGEFLPDAQKSD